MMYYNQIASDFRVIFPISEMPYCCIEILGGAVTVTVTVMSVCIITITICVDVSILMNTQFYSFLSLN